MRLLKARIERRFIRAIVVTIPGATLRDIDFEITTSDLSNFTAIYIMGGSNNLTVRNNYGTNIKRNTVEEMSVPFEESVREIVRVVKHKNRRCKVIFCTMYGLDLLTYNAHNNTTIVNPDIQQDLLNKTIWECNRIITRVNLDNNVLTPQLGRQIQRWEKKSNQIVTKFNRLHDGCHLSHATSSTVFSILKTAVLNNILYHKHNQ